MSSVVTNLSHPFTTPLSGYDLQHAIEGPDGLSPAFIQSPHLRQPLPNGQLPINYAIRLGKRETVQTLLPHVDPKAQDGQGLNSIDHAILAKSPEIVSSVFERVIGTAPDLRAKKSISPKQILKEKEETAKDADRLRAGALFAKLPLLHDAARKGNLEELKAERKKGTDLNAYDENGMTPLHHAALAGQYEVVKWLVKSRNGKTDLLAKNPEYSLLRRFASWSLYSSKADVLPTLTRNEGRSVLHFATMGKNPEIIQFLLKKDHVVSQMNREDAGGRTPLHYATASADLDTAEILVRAGADMLAGTQSTPLDMLLLSATQAADTRDPLKITPHQIALFASLIASHILQNFPEEPRLLSIAVQGIGSLLTFSSQLRTINLQLFLLSMSGLIYHILFSSFDSPLINEHTSDFILSIFSGLREGSSTGLRWALIALQGLNLVAKFRVAKNAIEGLVSCWKNHSIEPHRSIRNAVVHAVNGAGMCHQTIAAIQAGMKTNELLNKWDEEMEINGDEFRDLKTDGTWPYYNTEFRKKIEYITTFFARQAASSSSNSAVVGDPSVICAGKPEADCILALNPKNQMHAQHILDFSGIKNTVKAACKAAYRSMSLHWHPDRPTGNHNVFLSVQESAATLGCSK